MSAGRLKYVPKGGKGAKTPVFRLRFVDGGELQLTEAGSKKRAGVWLLRPEAAQAELAHLGPEANELDLEDVARILASDSRRLHSCSATSASSRASAVRGRTRSSGSRSFRRMRCRARWRATTAAADGCDPSEMDRGLELRLAGANDEKTYRVHDKLGRPCERCGTPIARVDFEEHTIYYCPTCQTGGRVLKDRRLSRLLK